MGVSGRNRRLKGKFATQRGFEEYKSIIGTIFKN